MLFQNCDIIKIKGCVGQLCVWLGAAVVFCEMLIPYKTSRERIFFNKKIKKIKIYSMCTSF